MKITWSWTTVLAVVTGLSGIAGTVLVPIIGTKLATDLQAVLQALSAVLIVITGGAATSVAHAKAKAKALAQLPLAGKAV